MKIIIELETEDYNDVLDAYKIIKPLRDAFLKEDKDFKERLEKLDERL